MLNSSKGFVWRLVLTLSLLSWGSEGIKVTCRDENNGEKDWFILYKAPKQDALTGLEYLYIDSNGMKKMEPVKPTASSGATTPPPSTYKPINHPEGVLAHTLRPLFTPIRSMPQNFGFISYSDQPPGCSASDKFGHSKGVLMVDRSGSGVWLLHSTPQFPFRRDQNHFWPDSGARNAQTFICVTFPYNQFSYIGKHLQYIGAFTFEHDLPEDFHQELKNAAKWISSPPVSRFQSLTSSLNTEFHSIAKQQSKQAKDGDLYVTIAREVNSDLDVQTWGCQRGRARSYCVARGPKIINIKTIKTGLGEWEPTHDHSKWCVARNQNNHWTCIADVNRAEKQYQRRGGALCIKNQDIKTYFVHFARGTEECTAENIMDILNTDCEPDPDTHMDPSLEG